MGKGRNFGASWNLYQSIGLCTRIKNICVIRVQNHSLTSKLTAKVQQNLKHQLRAGFYTRIEKYSSFQRNLDVLYYVSSDWTFAATLLANKRVWTGVAYIFLILVQIPIEWYKFQKIFVYHAGLGIIVCIHAREFLTVRRNYFLTDYSMFLVWQAKVQTK